MYHISIIIYMVLCVCIYIYKPPTFSQGFIQRVLLWRQLLGKAWILVYQFDIKRVGCCYTEQQLPSLHLCWEPTAGTRCCYIVKVINIISSYWKPWQGHDLSTAPPQSVRGWWPHSQEQEHLSSPVLKGKTFTGFARIKPRTDPKPTPCMIPSAPRMQPMGLRINLTRTGYRQTGAAQWVALGQAEQWETANAGTGLQLPWWQRGSYLPFTLKVKTVGWERTEQRSGDILATAPTETPWSSSKPFTWHNMYFMHFYIYINIHLQNMHISCIA